MRGASSKRRPPFAFMIRCRSVCPCWKLTGRFSPGGLFPCERKSPRSDLRADDESSMKFRRRGWMRARVVITCEVNQRIAPPSRTNGATADRDGAISSGDGRTVGRLDAHVCQRATLVRFTAARAQLSRRMPLVLVNGLAEQSESWFANRDVPRRGSSTSRSPRSWSTMATRCTPGSTRAAR